MPPLGQGPQLSPWPAMGRPWAYPPPSVSTETSRRPSANPDITANVTGMPTDWRALLCPHNMPTTSPWRNRHAGTHVERVGRRHGSPAGTRSMSGRRSFYTATFVTARLTGTRVLSVAQTSRTACCCDWPRMVAAAGLPPWPDRYGAGRVSANNALAPALAPALWCPRRRDSCVLSPARSTVRSTQYWYDLSRNRRGSPVGCLAAAVSPKPACAQARK